MLSLTTVLNSLHQDEYAYPQHIERCGPQKSKIELRIESEQILD
jgi:hypothetical protein